MSVPLIEAIRLGGLGTAALEQLLTQTSHQTVDSLFALSPVTAIDVRYAKIKISSKPFL